MATVLAALLAAPMLLGLAAGCSDDSGGSDTDAGLDAEPQDARPDVHVVRCGDGVKEGDEECDDGNLVPGDGCNQFCQIEARCGNGRLEAPEECDGTDLATNCVLAGHLGGPVSCDDSCKVVLDDCEDTSEDLVAWYHLDTVVNMVPDYSGNGHGCRPESLEGGYPGVVGEATLFDRSQQAHADCGTGDATAPLDGFDAITIEAWVKLNSYAYLEANMATVVSRNATGDAADFVYALGVAGVPYSGQAHHPLFAVGSPDTPALGASMLTTGQWTHLAGTYENGVLSVYVNGTLDGTALVDPPDPVPSVREARTLLGGLHTGQNVTDLLDGYVDEVKIWSVARTPQEICEDAGGFYDPASDPPCQVPVP